MVTKKLTYLNTPAAKNAGLLKFVQPLPLDIKGLNSGKIFPEIGQWPTNIVKHSNVTKLTIDLNRFTWY